MRKLFFTMIMCVLFFGNAFSQDKIVVTGFPSIYAKVVEEGGEKRQEGPVIKLITHIFKDYGVSVETKIFPPPRALDYLKTGKIDAILTLFYNEERAKFYVFTDAYDVTETTVFVKKGNSFPLNKFEDLIGKKGLAIRGQSEGLKWDTFKKDNLETYEVKSATNMIKMIVKGGRADYAVYKEYDTKMELNRLGYKNEIEFLPFPISKNEVRIAFSKKSPFAKQVPEINKKIAVLKKDGTIKKWINEVLNETD